MACQCIKESSIPCIDVSSLLLASSSSSSSSASLAATVAAIGDACCSVGFFQITHHGVSAELEARLEAASAAFFVLPREAKREIEMAKAGSTWRGYFEVGEELTSGKIDEKEGLYFARELPRSDPRPLHGANQWPRAELGGDELRATVTEWMHAMETLGRALLGGIALSLGLPRTHFDGAYQEPTTLFRMFNYPPHDAEKHGSDCFAVGKHSDYGYLTVLKQDGAGGLQVEAMGSEDRWIDVPCIPHAFVVNIGDMLEAATGGLLRATPHRVAQRSSATAGRLSWPFFYDPSFEAEIQSIVPFLSPALQARAAEARASAPARWDGARFGDLDLHGADADVVATLTSSGTKTKYGEYLVKKVSLVFPELAEGLESKRIHR